MNYQSFKTSQLKTLLPSQLTTVSDDFANNIRQNGIIAPIILCNSLVCDGHRRLQAAAASGIEEVPCLVVSGCPGLLFAALNSNREISAYEAAAAFSSIAGNDQQSFLTMANLSESPQMRFVLNFIATKILPHQALLEFSLPINVWRELGHLGQPMEQFVEPLLRLHATTGEKRNIAALLRQAQRRNALPTTLPGRCTVEILNNLQGTAQPRRTATLEKFAGAVEKAGLPPGASIKIDQSLAQPGMQISISLTRRTTQRLLQVKDAVESIFAEVEEL